MRWGTLARVHRAPARRVRDQLCSAHSDPAVLNSGVRDLSYEKPKEYCGPAWCEQAHDADDGVDDQ